MFLERGIDKLGVFYPFLNLSSWCIVMVERLFLAVPWSCLWFVIVVFPDHTHLLFYANQISMCLDPHLN